MDGGAWSAAVHGVAKSQRWLSDFTFTFHSHALEKAMATHSSVLAWRIPGMGEPGGLPSMGSHRVGPDWSDLAAVAVKALIPLIRVPPSRPSYIPKAALPSILTLGKSWFQHEFWGETNIQWIANTICFSVNSFQSSLKFLYIVFVWFSSRFFFFSWVAITAWVHIYLSIYLS